MKRKIQRPVAILMVLFILLTQQTIIHAEITAVPSNLNMSSLTNEEQTLLDSYEMPFQVTDAVIDPTEPVIYVTDKAAKKVYSYNYVTKATNSIAFDLIPEKIVFENNEIYVGLLKKDHDTLLPEAEQRGEIAILKPDSLALIAQLEIDIDPYDIAVDKSGNIYVSSGSSKIAAMKSYQRPPDSQIPETKRISTPAVSVSDKISEKSFIALHTGLNRIYTVSSHTLRNDIYSFKLENGLFINNSPENYDSPYNSNVAMDKFIKISPDGKYLVNNAGTVFLTSSNRSLDLMVDERYGTSFYDIVFDTENGRFFTSTWGGGLDVIQADSKSIIATLKTDVSYKKVFFRNNILLGLSSDTTGERWSLQLIDVNAIKAEPQIKEYIPNIELPGNIVDVKFSNDSTKAFAIDNYENRVLYVDLKNGIVEKSIQLPYIPESISISEDNTKLYISNTDENYLFTVVDIAKGSVLNSVQFKTQLNYMRNKKSNIVESKGKILVNTSETKPRLLMFDSVTFEKETYGWERTNLETISLTKNGTVYARQSNALDGAVFKSDIINSKLDFIVLGSKKLFLTNPEVPIIFLEDKEWLFERRYRYSMTSVDKDFLTFNEDIYAANLEKGIAVGKTNIYSINSAAVVGKTPVENADKYIFDDEGFLFALDRKAGRLYKCDISNSNIIGFKVEGQLGESEINEEEGTIKFVMPDAANINGLTPTIYIPIGSTISTEGTTTKDFNSKVKYYVSAPDGSIKEWYVYCTLKSEEPTSYISGKIKFFLLGGLPSEMKVKVTADNGENVISQTYVVPQYATSLDYKLSGIPKGSGYRIYYEVDRNTGLSERGFISKAGTNLLAKEAMEYDLSEGSYTAANITLLGNKILSGTLYLPEGIVAPPGGLQVKVYAMNSYGNATFTSTIQEGYNWKNYNILLPEAGGPYKIGYVIQSGNTDNKLEQSGLYNKKGTSVYYEEATEVLPGEILGSNINLNLLKAGEEFILANIPTKAPKEEIIDSVVFEKEAVPAGNSTSEVTLENTEVQNVISSIDKDNVTLNKAILSIKGQDNYVKYDATITGKALFSMYLADNFEVSTDIGSVSIPAFYLQKKLTRATDTVHLSISQKDITDLPGNLQNVLKDKPIIDVSAKYNYESMDLKNSNLPAKVSIPYQPSDEELANQEGIVIKQILPDGTTATIPSGRYNIASGQVEFTTRQFGEYTVGYSSKSFNDLNGFDWAQKEIQTMASRGIINGRTLESFSPSDDITRAEFITLLVRAFGITASFENNFSDIQVNDYFYEAVGISKEIGLTRGAGDNLFKPDSKITREEMFVLAGRALRYFNQLKRVGDEFQLQAFRDAVDLHEYSRECISAMREEGLIKGSGDYLYPQAYTTRAEAAVLIYRLYYKL